jgi:hypothetical protein
MTRYLKWLAFYLLFVPATLIGYSGDMIIPDRKDVEKMSLRKAFAIVVVVGAFLGVVIWALWLFFAQYL